MPGRFAAPATKGPVLIEQLNAIALGAESDDLALRRIGHEARKIMAADPVEAHTVLGAVAALEGRADDVRSHFHTALHLSGNSASVASNYSCALLNIGQVVEAFETAKQASQRAPDELLVLRDLITAALHAGHFREARLHQQRFSKLSPDPLPLDESLAEVLGGAVDRGAFHEESVQKILRVAHDILTTERIRRIGHSSLMADTTHTDSFFFEVHIFSSPERAAELNEVLATRIADQPELMADPGTKFVPMFIGVQAGGGHSASPS